MPSALLAAAPIVVVLVLMLGANWPAARAGAVGLVAAIGLAVTAFPFEPVDGDVLLGLGGSFAEAGFTTVAILWIVLPALAIYNLQTMTSAVDAIRTGLAGLSDDPRVTALVVAWFFALLLEGAAGFGTSAALAAPFMVALGMSPLNAVVAAMIGHMIGVTFGAVGTPVVPMVEASGAEPVELAAAIAVQATLIGWTIPLVLLRLIRRAHPDEPERPRRWWWALGAGSAAAFFVPFLVLGLTVGPELPTLAGAIVGGIGFVVVLQRRTDRTTSGTPPSPGMSLSAAMAPYLTLIAVVLTTRLVTPLRDVLEGLELSWELDGGTFTGAIAPLFHPGSMLFVALAAGAFAQRASAGQVRSAVTDAARTVVPVAGALLAMLGLARVMVNAAMVEEMGEAAADTVGPGWPLLAPAVGALGTFVTGSATASSALFSELQIVTATEIGDPIAATLGAQGVGGALGNAVAPHNLIAAAAVVGLAGRESDILRRTIPIALPLIAAAGVVALVVVNL